MIKVLWITNIMLPPVCKALNVRPRPVGGWMYSSLQKLIAHQEFNFAVATTYNGSRLLVHEVDGTTYYLLPQKSKYKTHYNPNLEKYWKEIQEEFKPDVVHVHGSEYPLGLSWVKSNGNKGVVCSIQGLVSVYTRYYLGGISCKDAQRSSVRDFLLHNGLLVQQKDFERRGKLEKHFLSSIKHIIGRTEWDQAHSMAINPNVSYYYCGETLRDAFYEHRWSFEKCNRHSIFASQAGYAIKGFHKLLMAFPYILKDYPDSKIYLTGASPFNKPFYKLGTYEKYIKKLIADLKIKEKIIFLGSLDEEQMCNQFLKCNVFVCPSAIENSPNSLGEAQIMGVPHVASFVGGIPEIVEYNNSILYRFDEHEMLAKRIKDIFKIGESFEAAVFDRQRYNGEYNANLLMDIYKRIAKNNVCN